LDALHLTPRQRQVAELLLRGLLIKRIAWHVGLTEATVKEYLAAVYKKAGVHHSREFIAAMLG
jgi:DNA-binding NarL/FixJ family response regulator